MANLTPEEQPIADDVIKLLAEVKGDLGKIIVKAQKLGQVNRDAGRMDAADGALEFWGMVRAVLGNLEVAHAVGSRALRNGYDNGGEIVALGGPR
jgi:hypothetical protein